MRICWKFRGSEMTTHTIRMECALSSLVNEHCLKLLKSPSQIYKSFVSEGTLHESHNPFQIPYFLFSPLLHFFPILALHFRLSCNLIMINKISSTFARNLPKPVSSLLLKPAFSVHDWSHIYDGIYKFQDNTLGEDLLALRSQALDFAKKKLSPYAIEWQKKEYFPVEAFREAAEMGFAAIYCKSGTGLSRLEASVIFEALSTGCVPTAAYLTIHNMCTWVIDQFGSEAQKEKHLARLISMEDFSSYCLTEPDSGSDSRAMKTFAKKDGGDYVLNGSKMFISGGSFSSLYIVMAKTSENDVSAFIVPGDAKGVQYGKKEEKMGWTIQPTALVSFDNVRIPAENLIGKQGDGFKIAMKALDGGRINIASCSLGGAAFCLQASKKYMNSRKQFNKKLSQFQYLQFKYADMAADLVSSRLIVRKAAELVDKNDANKTVYSAMAKKVATQLCSGICDYSLQIHGGYGYLKDYGIQKYVRDLRVHQILEGTNQIMRLIIARNLLKE